MNLSCIQRKQRPPWSHVATTSFIAARLWLSIPGTPSVPRPPACATSSPPPAPVHTTLAARGRAGGQTCQSQRRRHAAIPQTPITTQQGRGLATAWQPHGPIREHNNRDQRRPKKKEWLILCVCVRACTADPYSSYLKPSRCMLALHR